MWFIYLHLFPAWRVKLRVTITWPKDIWLVHFPNLVVMGCLLWTCYDPLSSPVVGSIFLLHGVFYRCCLEASKAQCTLLHLSAPCRGWSRVQFKSRRSLCAPVSLRSFPEGDVLSLPLVLWPVPLPPRSPVFWSQCFTEFWSSNFPGAPPLSADT